MLCVLLLEYTSRIFPLPSPTTSCTHKSSNRGRRYDRGLDRKGEIGNVIPTHLWSVINCAEHIPRQQTQRWACQAGTSRRGGERTRCWIDGTCTRYCQRTSSAQVNGPLSVLIILPAPGSAAAAVVPFIQSPIHRLRIRRVSLSQKRRNDGLEAMWQSRRRRGYPKSCFNEISIKLRIIKDLLQNFTDTQQGIIKGSVLLRM